MTAPARFLALPPLRAILLLGLPTTGVMVLGAASSVAHTYFVSRLGGDAIAAVSLVYPVILILFTMVGGGLGSGIAAAIASALGAGRRAEAGAVAEHAFVITWALGLVLTAALVLFAKPLFRLLGGQGPVLAAAVVFARVLFAGLLVTFTVSTFDSLLRGEGNVRVPTVWATTSLTFQIVLTPLFMFRWGLGIAGAAAATWVGQLVGAIPRALYVFGGRGVLHPRPWPRQLSSTPILEILRVGVPASLSTLLNYVSLVVLTGIVARYGTSEIAAFGLGTRLDFIILTLVFGIASAVLTLVGLASGAGDLDRARSIVRHAVGVVAPLSSLVAISLVWRPEIWLGLFTTDPQILRAGSDYVRAVAPSYPFVGASMILGFAFQGLRRAVFPLIVTVARTTAVVAGAIVLASSAAPIERLFVLMAFGNVAGAVVLGWRLRRVWTFG